MSDTEAEDSDKRREGIGLPILTGLVVWAILLVQEKCFRGILYSLSKLPLPFVTKIFRFWYDKEMFEILADPGTIYFSLSTSDEVDNCLFLTQTGTAARRAGRPRRRWQ